MLFHVGALWRLTELDKLRELTRISSVSAGSITAASLALAWPELLNHGLPALKQKVVAPLRALAGTTIDERPVVEDTMLPATTAHDVARAYAEHLFGEATLQDLPEEPQFIINATNLETGSPFRFSRREVRDWRVGRIASPTIRLADAVAASSAFPPTLSPFVLDVAPGDFDPRSPGELSSDSFRSEITLTDGGVYDNLGLQQVWGRCRTVLVSDAGGHIADNASPPADWAGQATRVFEVIDQQVRNLRMVQVVGSLADQRRRGAFWSMCTDIADYQLDDAMDCPFELTMALAAVPTRLRRLDAMQQERLINWGYAMADAGIRRYWLPGASAPVSFPYPAAGIG